VNRMCPINLVIVLDAGPSALAGAARVMSMMLEGAGPLRLGDAGGSAIVAEPAVHM
jgi:hypothetical protein